MVAADSACYIAKEKGRNRIHTFIATDKDQLRRSGEMRWMQRIQHALEIDNLVLYAQSIKPLATNSKLPTHYEFLLRLREEDILHTPYSFLSAAEHYNLMPDIDRWVVNNALTSISRICDQQGSDKPACYFHINLSGQSLNNDDFLDFVYQSLQQGKLIQTNVVFEITETAAIANMKRAIDFIKTIKQLGCRFALDDFGSGHVMQLQTMAKFVENDAIINKLIERNIDYGQGYAIAKPQPIEELFRTS